MQRKRDSQKPTRHFGFRAPIAAKWQRNVVWDRDHLPYVSAVLSELRTASNDTAAVAGLLVLVATDQTPLIRAFGEALHSERCRYE